MKARFDYGAMIFILTFSLVSVSGYHVDKLFELAHERLSTVAIGTSLCILISILVSPVWTGLELHLIIQKNLEKLAESLDGSISKTQPEPNTFLYFIYISLTSDCFTTIYKQYAYLNTSGRMMIQLIMKMIVILSYTAISVCLIQRLQRISW